MPAPMGRRVVAYLIDRFFVYGATMAAAIPYIWTQIMEVLGNLEVDSDTSILDFYADFFAALGAGGIFRLAAVVAGIFFAASGAYTIPQTAIWGQTIGKRITGLRVVARDGGLRVGWAAALWRWCLPSVVSFAWGVGSALSVGAYLWALTNPERRGLHDMVAGTTVVDSKTYAAADAVGAAETEQPSDTEDASGTEDEAKAA